MAKDKSSEDDESTESEVQEGNENGPEGTEGDGQFYNDRSKLDFDPDEGFYTGTTVTGDTEIPGEHEQVDDVPEESADDDTTDDSTDDDTDEKES